MPLEDLGWGQLEGGWEGGRLKPADFGKAAGNGAAGSHIADPVSLGCTELCSSPSLMPHDHDTWGTLFGQTQGELGSWRTPVRATTVCCNIVLQEQQQKHGNCSNPSRMWRYGVH